MNRLSARTVALFGYVDPVSALIFAAVFLHESMTPLQLAGAALVLAAPPGDSPARLPRGFDKPPPTDI